MAWYRIDRPGGIQVQKEEANKTLLWIQIIGSIILLAIQVALGVSKVLPPELMLCYPVLVLVWGGAFCFIFNRKYLSK